MIDIKISAIDHVVLNSADAERSVTFYAHLLGLQTVRIDDFRRGHVPFPSVRVNDTSILDFFPPSYTGDTAGKNLNHVAFDVAMPSAELERALNERGIAIVRRMHDNFAARGIARTAFHVLDPDGNLLELHSYEA